MRDIKTIIVIRVLISCEMARTGVKVYVRKMSTFGGGRTIIRQDC
jgi:ABC-type Mn2+/Zn2+ transport system permease subunit